MCFVHAAVGAPEMSHDGYVTTGAGSDLMKTPRTPAELAGVEDPAPWCLRPALSLSSTRTRHQEDLNERSTTRDSWGRSATRAGGGSHR
jgi:hypothetical protein